MVAGMPQPLLDAAREPFAAQAVIYALLLSRDDEATRTRQMQMLQAADRTAVVPGDAATGRRGPVAAGRGPAAAGRSGRSRRSKRSSPQQYAQFRQVVEALVRADGRVDLFEYCLRTVLFSYLDVHFGLKKPPAVRYRTIDAVAQPAAVVLSTLAYVGQKQPEDVQRAFQAGAQDLLGQAALVPARAVYACRTFDAALAELAQASPNVKRAVIAAVTACIAADGQVTVEESELLRAVAAVLACPVPPVAGNRRVRGTDPKPASAGRSSRDRRSARLSVADFTTRSRCRRGWRWRAACRRPASRPGERPPA